jgi:valyl-tRNA synthetase
MIPFITEEIWQRLPRREGEAGSIMVSSWPEPDDVWLDAEAERDMTALQELVVEVRRFRHEHRIPPSRRISAVVKGEGALAELVSAHEGELKALALLDDLRAGERPDGWSRVVAGSAEVYLPLAEFVDVGAERQRLANEIEATTALANRARGKLDNPGFAKGAPADVVEKTRGQLADHEAKIERMRSQLDELG